MIASPSRHRRSHLFPHSFEGAYGTEWEGEDTRSNIVRAQGGFTTTEAAAAREGFEGAYGSEWEGLKRCITRWRDGRDRLISAQAGTRSTTSGQA